MLHFTGVVDMLAVKDKTLASCSSSISAGLECENDYKVSNPGR